MKYMIYTLLMVFYFSPVFTNAQSDNLIKSGSRVEILQTKMEKLSSCDKLNFINNQFINHYHKQNDSIFLMFEMIDLVVKESGICSAQKTSIGLIYNNRLFKKDMRKWRKFYKCRQYNCIE